MDKKETSSGAAPKSPSLGHVLWPMVAVQFIISSALTVMAPFLPLYLIQLHIQPIARVEVWAGVLSSSNFLIAAFSSPIWGNLADKYGRKAMVLRSSIAISLFTGLMGLSHNVWQLLALRVAMGAFSGFSAAAIALVATQVSEQRLGYALGWLSTGQLLGGLIGPLLGGLLANAVGNYRAVFFWTSGVSAVGVILVLVTVKEVRGTVSGTSRPSRSLVSSWRNIRQYAGLGPMFVVLLLAQFSSRAVQPVVTVFVRNLLPHSQYLALIAGFAFSVTGLGDLIASPFLGKRSDVLGYKRVLSISLLGAALLNIPQALLHNIYAFIAARFIMGMFMGGILPTANALVGRLTPAERRGQIYGITSSATFIGSFLGPLTGGLVSARFGIPAMFLVTAALMGLNLVWVVRAAPDIQPKTRS